MKILLTNDDGLGSPALSATIEELEQIGDVTTVVPRHEQSWTSKANTRRADRLDKEIHEIDGREIITLNGQPADCANYGIYNTGSKPDLVVSGANIGHNIGISAFFSSGTIGAALEGLFAKIPSVAISVPYASGAKLVRDPFEKAITGVWAFLDRFYRHSPQNSGLAVLNIPYGKSTKSLSATSVAPFHYGSLFREDGSDHVRPATYLELQYPQINEEFEGTDVWARQKGIGSVVMMDYHAKFINPSIVSSWLDMYDLTELGDFHD